MTGLCEEGKSQSHPGEVMDSKTLRPEEISAIAHRNKQEERAAKQAKQKMKKQANNLKAKAMYASALLLGMDRNIGFTAINAAMNARYGKGSVAYAVEHPEILKKWDEHKKSKKAANKSRVGETKPKTPAIRVEGIDVASSEFLQSYAWRKVRMVALKKYGPRCQCCGATPNEGAVMNVDHIKPRRTHPQLALDVDNLQILCGECNHGKGNWDQTDWRPKA